MLFENEDVVAIEHNCFASLDDTVPKQNGIAIYHLNKEKKITKAYVIDDYHTKGVWETD